MTRHNTTIKTRRTDVIKRDVAPKFNESFSFKMTTIALLTYRDVEVSRPDRSGDQWSRSLKTKPVGWSQGQNFRLDFDLEATISVSTRSRCRGFGVA